MTAPSFSGIDPIRTRLRDTVSTVEQEISLLTSDRATGGAGARSLEALLVSWADLVSQLNLGPEPEVATCPRCSNTVMRAARLCGNCWMKLTPGSARAVG